MLSHLFAPHERTLSVMLARQAGRYGDKPFVRAGRTTWTFMEARDEAAGFAATLLSNGIKIGDRVALICSNRVEFLRVFLGCAWMGAVSVPINIASRGHQLQHILSNSGARLLVVEAAFAGNLDHLDFDALPLEVIWTIDSDTSLRVGPHTSKFLPAIGEVSAPAELQPRHMLTILYTSETTGPSKGVCCPHAQYFWWGVNTAALLELSGDDALYSAFAPLPYQRAKYVFPGDVGRHSRHIREAFLRV